MGIFENETNADVTMPQIKLACRLAFWDLRKNKKKFWLENSIFRAEMRRPLLPVRLWDYAFRT